MSTKDIVDERRRLEYIVDHCKFETPEQVTELFEAYTHLIWKYKQVGRIYDFYYDGMMIHREGNNDLIGVDQVVKDTLACLAAFPDMEFKFYDIHERATQRRVSASARRSILRGRSWREQVRPGDRGGVCPR